MKVLFIGPYKQADGWGEWARSMIFSLLATNIDLYIRPIILANVPQLENQTLINLENRNIDNVPDVIIQKALPEYFVYYPNVKNIGFFATETRHLEWTPWITKCNLMDEIWVSTEIERNNLIESGCVVPIQIVHQAIDTKKYEKNSNEIHKTFGFYTIGDGERKHIEALIIAFHREFDRNEMVELTIKTNHGQLVEHITNLKKTLCIYTNTAQYKQEKFIIGQIQEEDINKIHIDNDCFVMPSFGEAWCRPAMDALGFGKTPIITSNIGTTEFVNNDNGWIVDSIETPIMCQNHPLPYLYTGRETWRKINILALQKAMREAYTNVSLRESKAAQGKLDVQKYSYENIGQRLLKILCT